MNELLNTAPQLMLKGSEKGLGGGTIASVVITGIVVVFIGLILLILFVSIYGKVFDTVNKKKAAKAKAEAEAKLREASKGEPKPMAPVIRTEAPPEIEDGIEEEIVAVIAAAIAVMGAASGKKLALKSIKTARGSRSAWASAGIAENTRPF